MTLPKLNPNTPTLMDGEVRLFKRKRSSIWQVVLMMDGRQVRVSTKKRILKDAKDAAREIYLDYRFRDYIIVIDKYLVPFFGDLFVTSIDYEMLQKFARWREAKMGREPRAKSLYIKYPQLCAQSDLR